MEPRRHKVSVNGLKTEVTDFGVKVHICVLCPPDVLSHHGKRFPSLSGLGRVRVGSSGPGLGTEDQSVIQILGVKK